MKTVKYWKIKNIWLIDYALAKQIILWYTGMSISVCMFICLSVHLCTKYWYFCVANSSHNFAAVLLEISWYIDHENKLCKTQFSTICSLCFKDYFPLNLENFCYIDCFCQSYGGGTNSSPNDKILDWSKLKAFAGDKINVIENLKFVLGWEENIVGKGKKKCWFPVFSSFPTMFSKSFFLRVVKSRDCVIKS